VPGIAIAVLAATQIRIAPRYSPSGKRTTLRAVVSTASGERPTGTVTFTAGSKILRADSRLDGDTTTIKVGPAVMRDVITVRPTDAQMSAEEFSPGSSGQ